MAAESLLSVAIRPGYCTLITDASASTRILFVYAWELICYHYQEFLTYVLPLQLAKVKLQLVQSSLLQIVGAPALREYPDIPSPFSTLGICPYSVMGTFLTALCHVTGSNLTF